MRYATGDSYTTDHARVTPEYKENDEIIRIISAPNPYIKKMRKQISIRIDVDTKEKKKVAAKKICLKHGEVV